MTWSFGWNSSLPVYYIRENERVLLYASGHTGVIYNVLKNNQHHLQVCRLLLLLVKEVVLDLNTALWFLFPGPTSFYLSYMFLPPF